MQQWNNNDCNWRRICAIWKCNAAIASQTKFLQPDMLICTEDAIETLKALLGRTNALLVRMVAHSEWPQARLGKPTLRINTMRVKTFLGWPKAILDSAGAILERHEYLLRAHWIFQSAHCIFPKLPQVFVRAPKSFKWRFSVYQAPSVCPSAPLVCQSLSFR